MEKQFDLLKITRQNFLSTLDLSSPESLFTIPKGFNNNIFWNIMHVLASQQLLVYGLSQTPFRLDKDFVFQFKSGTQPDGEPDTPLVEFAKTQLLTTVDQLSEDYQKNIFGDFKPIKTSYGMKIQNVEDAIYFNNLHESMHLGQIKMLQKILNS